MSKELGSSARQYLEYRIRCNEVQIAKLKEENEVWRNTINRVADRDLDSKWPTPSSHNRPEK